MFKDTIDNITGMILLKDFHHEVINRKKSPSEILKPVVFVTKTIQISKLLRTLQQKQAHLAVVVDEFGGTLGIVTIEDIIEELVGEIWDEHDEVVEPVKKIADGKFIVMGGTNFADMLELLEADAQGVKNEGEPEAVEDAQTDDNVPDTPIGNWIMENLGRLPYPGEEFVWRNLKVRVLRILRHRVTEVLVSVIPKPKAEEETASGKE